MDVQMEDTVDVKDAQIERLQELIDTDLPSAINQLREFLKGRKKEEELDSYQERAVFELMRAYALQKNSTGLIALLRELSASFDFFSKTKRENIVKNVFDRLQSIQGTDDEQLAMCREYIEYFKKDKRVFLRQKFETKLAALLMKKGEFQETLSILSRLSSEVKKVDDKLLLVEIYLLESKVQFTIDNISKASSSLTAARANANAVYVGIQLQAEIDLQAGVLNAHQGDFRTAYSYFFEAHEGFVSKSDKADGLTALIYMILAKIMNGQAAEVIHILNFKNSLSFVSEPSIVILKEIAETVKERSLEKFSKLMDRPNTKGVVESDKLLSKCFKELENDLLEKNLARIIEPYSRIQLERVAQVIKMPTDKVLSKLTQMILDKKLRGIIDQGVNELIIYDEPAPEKTYENSLTLINNLGSVVNNLVRRAKHLQAH